MERRAFCAGIDIGGTKLSAALFSATGRPLGRRKTALDPGGGEAAARQVADVVLELEAEARRRNGRLLAAGLCIPGVVYQRTGRVWAPNIPGWDMFPLRARLAKRTRLPLVIESDRSAYIMGEVWRGAARGAHDAVFLAVGTGIGAGILAGGRLVHGHEDIAGAVGWFALDPAYKKDYARMGCFEAEASGASLGRKARARLAAGEKSLMRSIAGGKLDAVTAETVARAARRGDRLALRLVRETAGYLAMGVANIISILNPEVVVLGGGLFQAADLFLPLVRRETRRWAQPLAARAVRVEVSRLGEDAGLIGCGRIAWDAVARRGEARGKS